MGNSNSSFYVNGDNYSEATATSGESTTPPTSGNTAAPTSFYREGTEYATLENADTVLAALNEAETGIAGSEAAAAASALAAAGSASTAYTNALSAQSYASAASTSAGTATTEAGIATTQAGNAAASANAASTSETNAAASASSASTSASTATTEAGIATTEAGIATTQAGNAAASASAASTSAGNAHTSEVNAAASASAATTSASNAASAVQAAAGTAVPLIDGTAAVGTGTKWAHEDHVHPTDTTRAPLASPALTGTPTAPTPTAGDNTTKLATTAFIQSALGSYVTTTSLTTTLGSYATLASPALTGTPTAPTAAPGTNTTQIATTAYVLANGTSLGSTVPSMDGTAAAGTATQAARADHVHPTDTSRAPLASPTFTGTPAAPTAAVGTNTTQVATTAFVIANAGSGGGGSPLVKVCYGRLTATTGVAVTTSDVASATTLFFTPYGGAAISLYDGSAWQTVAFTEKSLSLTGLTASKPYDIFGVLSAGTLTLEALAWTNDTTRATALVLQDGVYVKSGAATRLYLGTIYTSATGTTCDTTLKRYIWNAYNQVPRSMSVADSTDSWASSATATTYRQANNSTANRVDFILGLAAPVSATAINVGISVDTTSRPIVAGIGLDTVTASSHTLSLPCHSGPTPQYVPGTALYEGSPAAGKHYLAWLDWCLAASTITFYGDAGTQTLGSFLMSGLKATMWC